MIKLGNITNQTGYHKDQYLEMEIYSLMFTLTGSPYMVTATHCPESFFNDQWLVCVSCLQGQGQAHKWVARHEIVPHLRMLATDLPSWVYDMADQIHLQGVTDQ